MLTRPKSFIGKARLRTRQSGIVLFIVLIVLLGMTMAGISLMRATNASTLIAGNLAFRQAATYYGDIGTESAAAWLQTNSTSLDSDIPSSGYFASTLSDPTSGLTWDDYWTSTLDPNPVARPVSTPTNSGNVWTLATDSSTQNTVSYVIQRLCRAAGASSVAASGCISPPAIANSTQSSMGAGFVQFNSNTQVYYRITARIEGPRNTVSYVQTIVSQ
jgi:Tfp pilus assembly protein PilX